ncbi:hypothetical protein HDZ31DRAFT_61384 [Schizophyllum fasciatum]
MGPRKPTEAQLALWRTQTENLMEFLYTDDSRVCKACGITPVNKTEHAIGEHGHEDLRAAMKHFRYCRYCDFVTRVVRTFESHINEHHGTRPYTCKYCGQSFPGRNELQRIHHPKAHPDKQATPAPTAAEMRQARDEWRAKEKERSERDWAPYSGFPAELNGMADGTDYVHYIPADAPLLDEVPVQQAPPGSDASLAHTHSRHASITSASNYGPFDETAWIQDAGHIRVNPPYEAFTTSNELVESARFSVRQASHGGVTSGSHDSQTSSFPPIACSSARYMPFETPTPQSAWRNSDTAQSCHSTSPSHARPLHNTPTSGTFPEAGHWPTSVDQSFASPDDARRLSIEPNTPSVDLLEQVVNRLLSYPEMKAALRRAVAEALPHAMLASEQRMVSNTGILEHGWTPPFQSLSISQPRTPMPSASPCAARATSQSNSAQSLQTTVFDLEPSPHTGDHALYVGSDVPVTQHNWSNTALPSTEILQNPADQFPSPSSRDAGLGHIRSMAPLDGELSHNLTTGYEFNYYPLPDTVSMDFDASPSYTSLVDDRRQSDGSLAGTWSYPQLPR